MGERGLRVRRQTITNKSAKVHDSFIIPHLQIFFYVFAYSTQIEYLTVSILKAAKSQKVFHFGTKLKKKVPNHYFKSYSPKRKDAQGSDWALFIGDLS